MNETRYAHIGTFQLVSGTMDIADPYINPLTVAVEQIPLINEKMIKVTNMLCGSYDAYHLQECYEGNSIGLLLLHNAYSLKDIEDKTRIFPLGYASSSIGSGIVAVDEAYRFSTKYCYYPIESDAYYNRDVLLQKLPEMGYNKEITDKIKNMLNECKGDDGWIHHPTGQDLINIIGEDKPIWCGFSAFGCHSSQWSIDIMNRMNESFTSAAIIKGGIVSSATNGFSPCYKYLNDRLNAYAVYISLVDCETNNLIPGNEFPDFV